MSHELAGMIVATFSKHATAGTIAVVIGAILLVIGAMKIAARTAMAFLYPLAGLVVVVIGILFFTRKI